MDFKEKTPLSPNRPESVLAPATFDVCHVGVVLRVVLGVQAVLWLAAAQGVRDAAGLLAALSQAIAVGLPASLLWLVGVCAARRWLAPWTPRRIGVALSCWGAVSALYGVLQFTAAAHWQGLWPWSVWSLGPVAVAGACLGLACHVWLVQRQQRHDPALVRARLAELQARIQPHFLFNALNTAIALVQVAPQQAEAVLEDLAELFRRALSSPTLRSTLAQELELARRYLAIEQLRFGSRLSVDWQVGPGTGEAVVPALCLQPLVENAVKHGAERMLAGGWVRLAVERRGDRVWLQLTNALPGAPDGALAPTPSAGQGMALANVEQRLRLLHDVEVRFQAGPVGQPPLFRVAIDLPAPAQA